MFKLSKMTKEKDLFDIDKQKMFYTIAKQFGSDLFLGLFC